MSDRTINRIDCEISADGASGDAVPRDIDELRRQVDEALFESYAGLWHDGRRVTRREIERDADKLYSGNFRKWVGLD